MWVCMCAYVWGLFAKLLSLFKKFHESSIFLLCKNVHTLKVCSEGHASLLSIGIKDC